MQLLDHVSISVAGLDTARPFYDAVMAALGAAKVYDHADALGYGERCRPGDSGHTYLSVQADPAASPSAPARRHWCFKAASRAAVDAFHAAGLAHGGRDEGAPPARAPTTTRITTPPFCRTHPATVSKPFATTRREAGRGCREQAGTDSPGRLTCINRPHVAMQHPFRCNGGVKSAGST